MERSAPCTLPPADFVAWAAVILKVRQAEVGTQGLTKGSGPFPGPADLWDSRDALSTPEGALWQLLLPTWVSSGAKPQERDVSERSQTPMTTSPKTPCL